LELLQAVDQVLTHGRIVLGPEVTEFEIAVADRCHRAHGIGVNSGTDALYLSLRALGIGRGDEVITTSLSWIATANAIALTGAEPVFADIQDDLNICPQSVDQLITERTKAIVPVHYTGRVCDMDAIRSLADGHGLLVIEDAAQAFGAELMGSPAGSFGDVSCFSMNPMKVLAACGEAGMIVTDRQDVQEKLLALRYNGTVDREACLQPGLNARLDTIQAAMLLVRLSHLESVVDRRRQIAAYYAERLSGVVRVPQEGDARKDVYYTYTIQASKRDELKAYLEGSGIETKIQHPILMSEQRPYKDSLGADRVYRAKEIRDRILCIPANETLSDASIEYVADTIVRFYEG